MRLRPSGLTGPVATSLKSFKDYYKFRAWEWEKIAIKKTKVISLEKKYYIKLNRALQYVKKVKIEVKQLASEIIKMKQTRKLNDLKSNKYETKYVDGGQRDLEFLISFIDFSNKNIQDKESFAMTQKLYDSIDQIISSCFEKPIKENFSNSFIDSLLKFTGISDVKELDKKLKNSKILISKKLNYYLKIYSNKTI